MNLASPVPNLGNFWAVTLLNWVATGLMIALTSIVLVHAVRRMSIKSAIGGMIGLVVCWSLFTGRYSLSSLLQVEYTTNQPTTTAPIQGAGPAQRELPLFVLPPAPGRA